MDRRYLENPVVTALAHPEAFDCHRRPRIYSLTHVCERALVVHPVHVYLPSENIPGGDDAAGFADLGKQQQTPLTEFVVER